MISRTASPVASTIKHCSHSQFSRHLSSAQPKIPIKVFDTTLRDGEQSPGCTMTFQEKLFLAEEIFKMGVNVMEAGFPIASPGDFDAVSHIATTIGKEERKNGGYMSVAGLCRAVEKDIECCWQAVQHAKAPRIHTFLATSDIHLKHKLNISREKALDKIYNMVRFAKDRCVDVEFSAEDSGRSDLDFLVDVSQAAIDAGATTINLPDTVGYSMPQTYGAMFSYMFERCTIPEGVVFSTHCHNDLGLGTANSLAGVLAGCRQIECTINGIGERAGNTAMEEIVMVLKTHEESLGFTTTIDTKRLGPVSRMVQSCTDMAVAPNKSVVGHNAFRHEAGIHQDGVLKHRESYEIMTAELVGWEYGEQLVIGKHSGAHAVGHRLKNLGYECSKDEIIAVTAKAKEICDTEKNISDEQLAKVWEMIQASQIKQANC